MRLTNKLCAQHLGWMFKKHWQVQGQRIPRDTGAAAELEKLGITVKDVHEVLTTKVEHERVEIEGFQPAAIPEDESHPNWHKEVCHIFGNGNVLLEGVLQAQLLTKTIEIRGLPKNIEDAIKKTPLPSSVDRNVQSAILASLAFDAEQTKLPKMKLPERPAYNLPRQYGISHERKNRLLVNKLISECERIAGRVVTAQRRIIDNSNFKVTIPKGEDLLQFDVTAEKMITSVRPLEAIKGNYDSELPDLYPIKCTITIPKKHIYTTDTFYPFSSTLPSSHPHTIFLDFNKEKVHNLHGTSVSCKQFQSRNMMKTFAVAAARAKQLYGNDIQNALPKPIVVQSIHSDGRSYHFGIFQLNTLAIGGDEGLKNVWFHEENVDLFKECGYKSGRPILEGYNKDVFRIVNAFYNNS